MTKLSVFKLLIIAQWALTIIGGTLDESIGNRIMSAEAYKLYTANMDELSLLDPLMGIAVICLLAGSIGMYFGKRRFYWIFIFSFILTVFISPFYGDFIASGLSYSLYSIAGILTGMSILIGYEVTSKAQPVD